MKALSPKATAIMLEILTGIEESGDAKKLDSERGFMPLHVEWIGVTGLGKLFSLAHYGKMNGDLMKDPEMVFLKTENGNFFPASFTNDYAGFYREGIQFIDSELLNLLPKEQADQAEFAEIWLENIKEQQFTSEKAGV